MDLTSAVTKELSTYLASKLPSEFTIIEEFPGPNTDIQYPTVSIEPGKAIIDLKHPELISYTDKPNTVATVVALFSVANIRIPIQLDLFCMSVDQRKYYNQILMNALFQNPARSSDINLNLTEHHNVHANYQISDSMNYGDTSKDAMVSDYRVKYDILCTTELAVTKDEYKILHLYLHLKVYRSEADQVDIKQIF